MQIETAIRQYRDALKQVTRYGRLAREADYGGRHSAQRVRYARQQERQQESLHTTRRDEALAALQSMPEGVTWLAEQDAAERAAMHRKWERYQAANRKRMVDEYLITWELKTQSLFTWRMYVRFGREQDAAETLALYQRTAQQLDSLRKWIDEHEAWLDVRRREAAIQRAQREPLPPPEPPVSA